ncbi:MAG TPA: ATP-binding protein [Candidatus Azoamicus sp.]
MNYIVFINNKCVFCNNCLDKCPTHAIKKDINGFFYIKDSGCLGCLECFKICPVNAIEFYKIKANIKINKYVFKDIHFVKKTLYSKIYDGYFNIKQIKII